MIIFIFLTLLFSANSFKLLDHVHFNFQPGDIVYCDNIDYRLLETLDTIVDELNHVNNFGLILTDKQERFHLNATTICNKQIDGFRFGHFIPPDEIVIADKVLNYENTMYNVVLHEILHYLGLNHSIEKGMMNYKVRTVMNSINRLQIKNDQRKLWLSIDDYLGLIEIYL
jgi:hypothetical protein